MDHSNEFLQNVAKSLANERFKLILFPTENCNFRCLYCYEDHVARKFSSEVEESIKLFLDKRIPTLKLFELEWFGGEPLLEKKIIYRITRHAQLLCEKYNVVFNSIMTTNGYLLDVESFKILTGLCVKSYQVTFDGDKENHNQFRLLAKSDRGSFDIIWDNLLKIRDLKELDYAMLVRCHLTSINTESVKSFLRRFRREFSTDKRFFVHLKEISPLGSIHDDSIQHIDKTQKKIVVGELKNEFKDIQFIDIGTDYVCYAAKPNCFFIRADGQIGKCTVALESDINNIGNIKKDGTLNLDNKKFLKWLQGFDTLDKEFLDCPYYTLKRRGEL